jgi:TatD family-associated radical SAM protein
MGKMSPAITYEVGNSLYINITNRCTNRCSFCIRNNRDGVGSGANLWLEQEPTAAQVVADIRKRDISKYREFVFCGFGEPMIRTYDVIEICKQLKQQFDKPIRINTNGQANLICGKDITPLLAGLVDSISISLNTKNKNEYQAFCRSCYGDAAFEAMLDFTVRCKEYIPKVILSVVDFLSEDDIAACRKIAQDIGVDFRVRHFAS